MALGPYRQAHGSDGTASFGCVVTMFADLLGRDRERHGLPGEQASVAP
jgi:hypothetical protein